MAEREGSGAEPGPGVQVWHTPHLRSYRRRALLTQRELAKQADVSREVIINGESGRPVSLKSLRKLAKALGVEPKALLELEEEE
jgi:DNA-binding XRE family transcriptional regulator